MRRPLLHLHIAGAISLVITLSGCGKNDATDPETTPASAELEGKAPAKSDDPSSSDSATPPADNNSADASTTDPVSMSLGHAEERLQAGEVDMAAAELLKLQAAGGSFDADRAAAYREALSRTTAAAMEAASHGDARGEAALQMLRATRLR